jgi:two-component system, NtrC family, response regulator AtoC
VRGRILIVDDEPELCRLIEAGLGSRGFNLRSCHSIVEADESLRREDFDAAVIDLNLRGESGLTLCTTIVRDRPEIPVVIITAFGSLESAVGAIRSGAYDFITKPFEIDALDLTLERAVRHRRLKDEVRRLRRAVEEHQGFEEMLGASPPMQQLFDLIRRIADSDASVLITGESGSGKEGVARAIHRSSRGRGGPFVAFSCAAVPETLIESELFGHARGAFTDAKGERTGYFVQADGGTLFLDEIGDLALTMQPKLLRALQERRVRPLGSSADVPFRARFIAATNRDLEEDVRTGRFREDLFFRVQVIHIEVPPLRARGNDVLLLAQYFLNSLASRSGKPAVGLAHDAARKLRDYPWPGNVRELQNCMERAVALCAGSEITVEDLPERIRRYRTAPPPPTYVQTAPFLSLEEVERRHILHVLESVSGNKSQAARFLKLDRKSLYRKLEQYGLLDGEAKRTH